MHPNGNRYRWDNGFDITKIANATDIVYRLVGLSNTKSTHNRISDNIIPEGSRNDTLYRMGCSMQGRGVDDDVIYSKLSKINISQCKPPLEESELIRIYNSVVQLPKGSRTTSALPKCDDDMVCNSIQEQIQQIESEYPYVDVHY